jgi:hypothetical protein
MVYPMNARDSIAYFKSIGWELRPSKMERQRWWLSVFGDDDGMHFTSLPDMWDYFKNIHALDHFQQEWIAERVLDIVLNDSGLIKVEAEKQLRGEANQLLELSSDIWDQAPEDMSAFPRHWRSAYAKLIQPLGAPQHPVYGCLLKRGLLALFAEEAASYRQTQAGNGHVKETDTAVGRSPA